MNDNNISAGIIVGLAFASSVYVWNSPDFTKNQKVFLLISVIFPPLQWISILLLLVYRGYRENNSAERVDERKVASAISYLTELKEKGILTEEEYNAKVGKIELEKEEQNIKNSIEYKQLKSLLDSSILTKEEFDRKVKLISKVKPIEPKTETLEISNTEIVQKKESFLPYFIIAVILMAIYFYFLA
jgi:uncharacterized membrane protein